MNRRTLSDRDRRALRLGAFVLVPAAIWFLAAAPYLRALQQANDLLEAERGLLDREVALVAGAVAFPAAWETGTERLLDVIPRTFGGESPAVASAALARYLQDGANLSRVLLTQVEPGPPQELSPGTVGLPLHVEGESDLEGVISLLYALEAGAKLIRVEDLRVRGRGLAPRADQPEVLSFVFTATGYMLTEIPVGVGPSSEEGAP